MAPMLKALSALLLCVLSGCYATGDPYVLVTSTPAGADIYVDNYPTGQTTPAMIDLGGIYAPDHEITIRKEGFTDESRWVYHYTRQYTPRWIDGSSAIEIPAWPLEWTMGDIFLPLGVRWRYVPHEVHAVLYAQGMEPVHSEDGE